MDNTTIPNSQFVAIPGSNFVVFRKKVQDGVHTVNSDKPASIVVYGYDKDVSYGYPGGLGLQDL